MLELEKRFVFRKYLSFWWYNFLSLSKLLASNNEQKQYLGFIGHKTLICEHITHNIFSHFTYSRERYFLVVLFSLVFSFPISHIFGFLSTFLYDFANFSFNYRFYISFLLVSLNNAAEAAACCANIRFYMYEKVFHRSMIFS